MAAHSFESIYRLVKKGEFAPVYYLTGDEDVLKDELADVIAAAAVDAGSRDFNLDVRSAADLDGESLHALVETPPMLSERRVVILRNLEQWRTNAKVWQVLHRYLERPSPTTVLILTHGAGEKPDRAVAGAVVHADVGTLPGERLARWLRGRAERAGLQLEPEAADHLIEAVGGNMARLTMEIEKLAAAVPADRPATVTDVGALVGVYRGETLQDWVNAVLDRDPARAAPLIDLVLSQSGVTAVRMLTALGTALVGIRSARAALDAGSPRHQLQDLMFRQIQAARVQNVKWSDEAKRWARAAERWSGTELDRAIRTVYEADRALKSATTSDERGLLLSVVLELAGVRVAA